MASNSFGELLRLTSFGESHGPAIGVVIDGCPAGVPLCAEDFVPELQRRRPGQSALTTSRQEADTPVILSGVFEGRTIGSPLTVIVENTNQRSGDYDHLRTQVRAGHADAVYQQKYGHRDHRGGGRSSGRETIARVIAGVVARKLLPADTRIIGHTVQIGPITGQAFDAEAIEQNAVRCADAAAAKSMAEYILACKERHDSVGGMIEIRVENPPANLGEPTFRKMKAVLADALMSIGAITGFDYGAGFRTAGMHGTEYVQNERNFGGILGGITTGGTLALRCSIKPASSIGDTAKQGRHDPCIVPRVIPVAEAMVAFAMADLYLSELSQQAWRNAHLPSQL